MQTGGHTKMRGGNTGGIPLHGTLQDHSCPSVGEDQGGRPGAPIAVLRR